MRLGLAAAAGAAIALCFLRFELWPLAWIAFVPILLAVATAPRTAAAARAGFIAGIVTNVPAFHWLVHTIHVFGGFPISIAAFFYALLSSACALQFVLFAIAVRRSGFGPLAIFPALHWVALEFLFPNLFPWRLANSQFHVLPLLQIGEVTGPFGLSFVMVWASAAVVKSRLEGVRSGRMALAGASLAIAAVVAYGAWRIPRVDRAIASAPVVRVAIVQGNLSIEEKGDVRYFEGNLATYRELTRAIVESADVVIWPETVITEPLPRSLTVLPEGARTVLGLERPLLAGALTYTGAPEDPIYYNSVLLFDGEGRIRGTSDKQILMPFGEYMPLSGVFPWLADLSPMTGDFAAGSEVVVLDVPGAGRFAPLNCYEDLRASIARDATVRGRAEVLFAVANDAWFGDTAAPFQHEALALWRAIEARRFLIRVTNTGVTDVIDPAGRVLVRFPVFEPHAQVAEVRRLAGTTPYLRFGDTFAWLVVAAAATTLLASRASTRSEKK